MSDNTKIIANTENIEQVVLTFSSQLEEYVNKMSEDVARIRNAVAALQAGWSAEDYNTFASLIEAKMLSVSNELDTAKQLKTYLDEVAVQLRDFLDTLKKAGNTGNN